MKKRKVSVIAVAILTCIVCLSMIAGATFALFTDNDSVNVSVTTAKLNVSADIDTVGTGSNGTTENTRLSATYDKDTKTLSVVNMLPGDVVTFKVNVKSSATVDVKYRLSFGSKDESNALFDELLLGVKDTAEAENYDYYISSVSAWETIYYNTDETKMVESKYVALELPAYVSAKSLENQTCNIEFAVEAVQDNASGTQYESEAKAVRAYRVTEGSAIDGIVSAETFNDKDVIVLDGENGNDWSIVTDAAKEFYVKGCDVKTLTVDAPNATIHYQVNYTNKVDVVRSAPLSFHVYGTVAEELVVKEGRAVVEAGAKVAAATVQPEAEKAATIVTNEAVKTLTVAGAGVANVEVAKEVVVEKLEVTNTNDETAIALEGKATDIVIDENAGAIDLSQNVTNVKELKKAIAVGGEVVLNNDLTLTEALVFKAGKEYTLNLNGHTIVYAPVEDVNARPLYITAGAKLTVVGKADNGDMGKIVTELTTVYGIFEVYGDLVVDGGHYEDRGIEGGAVVRGRPGSTTHILDGEFVSYGHNAAINDEGDSVIEKGYFYTNASNRINYEVNPTNIQQWSYCVRNDMGTMHIKYAEVYGVQGGISAAGTSTIIDDCDVYVRDPYRTSVGDDRSFYALYVNGNHQVANCIVNGGTFVAQYRAALHVGNNTPGDGGEQLETLAEIYGGTFTTYGECDGQVVVVQDPNGNIDLPGGKYIAHVQTATQLKNALATVVNMPDYTIVLDADIADAKYVNVKTNDVTIDLNGHKLECYMILVIGVNATVCNGDVVAGYDNIRLEGGATVTLRDVNASAWGTQAVYSETGICTIESGKYFFSYKDNQHGYLYGTGVNYSVYPGLNKIVDLEGNQINEEGSVVEIVYSKELSGVVVTVDGEVFKDADGKPAYLNRYLLNNEDDNYRNGTANVVVKGGEFCNFNPACNMAENENTNFVAEGYSVVYAKIEGNYIFKVMADGEVENFLAENEGWTLDA